MFKTDPGLVPIVDQPDLWYLDGPLVWVDVGITITVPPGLVTDDASIPKFVDWIPFADRQGLSRRPGLLHDALYVLAREKGKDFADRLLREACLAEGMKHDHAEAIYLGVHVGGDQGWADDAGKGGVCPPVVIGNFFTQAYRDAWIATGGSLFS
jgi:hypothetical protein